MLNIFKEKIRLGFEWLIAGKLNLWNNRRTVQIFKLKYCSLNQSHLLRQSFQEAVTAVLLLLCKGLWEIRPSGMWGGFLEVLNPLAVAVESFVELNAPPSVRSSNEMKRSWCISAPNPVAPLPFCASDKKLRRLATEVFRPVIDVFVW